MGKANEKAKITQEQAEAIGLLRNAGISVEELDMALRGDYEIVPEYSVGDYVHHIENNVTQFLDTSEEIAREKERAFFAKHGRKRWELREGDVLVNVFSGKSAIVSEVRDDRVVELDGVPYTTENVSDSCRVVAFVEGRLDGVHGAHKLMESRRANGNF